MGGKSDAVARSVPELATMAGGLDDLAGGRVDLAVGDGLLARQRTVGAARWLPTWASATSS